MNTPAAEQSGEASAVPATAQETGALARLVEQLEALNNTDALPARDIAGLLSRYDRLWQDIGSPGEAEEALRQRALPVLSALDRKSTRLNSSHVAISYAVFCLKKKNRKKIEC